MRKIVISPIKETKSYIHFVAYEATENEMVLIRPKTTIGAIAYGMSYNINDSNLPAYTFKLEIVGAYKMDTLVNMVKKALEANGEHGEFKLFLLDGNYSIGAGFSIKSDMKKITPHLLHGIYNRKMHDIDCTEEESAELKQYLQAVIDGTENPYMVQAIKVAFPLEYAEVFGNTK